MTVAEDVLPFLHFDAEVTAVAKISEHLTRVTFGGRDLRRITTGGPDQRIKLFLPRPGSTEVTVPTGADWYATWQKLPDDQRPTMRTYTIRALRPGEIDVDFVLHGDLGPASRWAGQAKPGDRVVLWGPNAAKWGDNPEPGSPMQGADYAPREGTDWQLIAGDETALPAIGGIVESLPAGARALIFVEVPEAADQQVWQTEGDVTIRWFPRDRVLTGESTALVNAIRSADFPDGQVYAWLAGEAGTVRALRRHLVTDRGIDRKLITFCGYWRHGKNEDAPYDPDDHQA
ncbi:NADPH-dependent ferric siderophore reductase [Herbihabitans rhizosphaerae]|uniref:NADPH-dependent ferric siderophore reductase n=1 Tax=Herbihabitans rhizosphaerae TaxID=1872711 RepID=A0A4Q7KBQ7_9PSEU|nr:siderophore-interacting protein [Herbihabitans rhizosphaerae]RZS29605.1 NADPH-dependent ferric siderophore reductase [Herbihabitans rhizosphaerae]